MRLRHTAPALVLAAATFAQLPERIQVGPLPDGGVLLPSGWILRPAGRQTPLGAFPMSTALSPDGKYLLVLNAGAGSPSISVLDPATAKEIGRTPVPGAWLGLAFAPKGNLVYAGGGAQAAVFEFSFSAGRLQLARAFPVVDPAKRTPRDFIGDVALSPDGRLIYAANLYRDSVVVINPQSGMVIQEFKTGRRPYRILFHPDGKSFFVSSWADGAVLRHETDQGAIMDRLRLGPHPTDMIWVGGRPKTGEDEEPAPYVARIFVSLVNTTRVAVLGINEANDALATGTIDFSMTPRQPAGMTPAGLAADASRGLLYVACSGANAVAVADVTEARVKVLGLVPSGAYPTALRALAGERLVIVNGKGGGSTGSGSVSFVEPMDEAELASQTRTVFENSPYRDSLLDDAGTGAGNPIPARPGDLSPVEHVVYILKGGLSYDEVLGDLKEGNGDASLARYGERVSPNHHKLAREFVLLDNFYVNGDNPVDGAQWSTAAIASDYVQKLGAQRGLEAGEPAAFPPAGYLWNNALQAQIPLRNYGCFPQDVVLKPHTTPGPPTEALLKDLAGYERSGQMPRLLLVCLSEGSVPETDRALGAMVEAVSKSRFWPRSAIFVLESGAAGGKDHVDPHRAPAFVISPYARRRSVDSTFYSTTSALRTMELILGLHPMTHFDAAARPMATAFQATPDATPYAAVPPPR